MSIQTPLIDGKIAVVDIETTGFSPRVDLIVEIGICSVDIITEKIDKLFDSTIREKNFDPDIHGSAWIFSNSNLTPKDVLEGKDLAEVFAEIQHIFDSYPVIAYNMGFDFGFLEQRGFIIRKRLSDPMFVATDVLKLDGYYDSYKWPRVTECLSYFKIDEIEKHRGYSDCVQEARIFLELVKLGEYPELRRQNQDG